MLTTALTLIPTMMISARERAKDVIEEINSKCAERKVPTAFEVGSIEDAESLDEIHFRCNSDFRFEGFGVAEFPPKLTFYVWYKKGAPDGVEVGRFKVGFRTLDKIALDLVPIGRIRELADRVGDVREVVEDITED